MYGILHPNSRSRELPVVDLASLPPLGNQRRIPKAFRPTYDVAPRSLDDNDEYPAGYRPGFDQRAVEDNKDNRRVVSKKSPRRSPKLMSVEDIPEEMDYESAAAAVGALRQRVRNVDQTTVELRRELEELRTEQRNVVQRVAAATHDVRERGEVSRRTQSEDVRELRLELAGRLETAEGRLRAHLASTDGQRAAETAQLAEIRGALKAMRDEHRRQQSVVAERDARVLEVAREAGEKAERAAQLAQRDSLEQVQAALRGMGRVGDELDDVRRQQGGLNAKVEAELAQGRVALVRAAAAAGHADTVAATAEADVIERWRVELGSLEQRLGAEIARCRANVNDEQRRRERFTSELQVMARRSAETTDQKVEDLAVRLAEVNLRLEQRGAAPPAGFESSQEITAASSNTHPQQLEVLEAQLERVVAESSRSLAEALQQSTEDNSRTVEDLRAALNDEVARRESLEGSCSRAIQSGVKSLATAIQKELKNQSEQMGSLELKSRSLEQTTKQRIDERTAALEEALVERVTEREKKITALKKSVGKLGHDLLASLSAESDKNASVVVDLEKRTLERTDDSIGLMRKERSLLVGALGSKTASDIDSVRVSLRDAVEELKADDRALEFQARSDLDETTSQTRDLLDSYELEAKSRNDTLMSRFELAEVHACAREMVITVELRDTKWQLDTLKEAVSEDRANAKEEALEERSRQEQLRLADQIAALSDKEALQAALGVANSQIAQLASQIDLLSRGLGHLAGKHKDLELRSTKQIAKLDSRACVSAAMDSIINRTVERQEGQEANERHALAEKLRVQEAEKEEVSLKESAALEARLKRIEAATRHSTEAWATTVHAAATALKNTQPPAPRSSGARSHVRSVFPPQEAPLEVNLDDVFHPTSFFPAFAPAGPTSPNASEVTSRSEATTVSRVNSPRTSVASPLSTARTRDGGGSPLKEEHDEVSLALAAMNSPRTSVASPSSARTRTGDSPLKEEDEANHAPFNDEEDRRPSVDEDDSFNEEPPKPRLLKDLIAGKTEGKISYSARSFGANSEIQDDLEDDTTEMSRRGSEISRRGSVRRASEINSRRESVNLQASRRESVNLQAFTIDDDEEEEQDDEDDDDDDDDDDDADIKSATPSDSAAEEEPSGTATG